MQKPLFCPASIVRGGRHSIAAAGCGPRLRRQIEICAEYSPNSLLACGIPEYLTPMGGPDARLAYQQYLQLFDKQ
jgi:hypothetical protein